MYKITKGFSFKQASFNHSIVCSVQDCYLLDQGGTQIFVWKGKKASKAERQAAMARALVRAPSHIFAWVDLLSRAVCEQLRPHPKRVH